MDVPKVVCEMSPSQVIRSMSLLEPSLVVHLVCGLLSCGSSAKLVSCSTRVPKLVSSVPSHDHVSSSGTGKSHPIVCSVVPLLPTVSRWRWCNAISFPPFCWVIRVLIWPLEEPVQLMLLLFCERNAQAVHERFYCHGDLFRFPIAACQFSWCWRLVDGCHVVPGELVECLLSFCQFGLQFLHVREKGGILSLDSIDLLLQLVFPYGHGFEVGHLAFELGCNLPLSARFRCRELSHDLLDLGRQSVHVVLQYVGQLWFIRFGWSYAKGLELHLCLLRQ